MSCYILDIGTRFWAALIEKKCCAKNLSADSKILLIPQTDTVPAAISLLVTKIMLKE